MKVYKYNIYTVTTLLQGMGFTPESISTPLVPDGLDPLTYLTLKPTTKAQESAQIHAHKLAFGFEIEDHNDHQSPSPTEYDEETRLFYQNKKTTQLPSQLEDSVEDLYTEEYPFFSTFKQSSRVREVYSEPLIISRNSSKVGAKKAPLIEIAGKTPLEVISEITEPLNEFGMVKVKIENWSPRPLDFNVEHAPILPIRHVLLSEEPEDFEELLDDFNLGFTRALVRFHAIVIAANRRITKLPEYDRRPVDLFRLYCAVARRGGHHAVTRSKEWAQVGRDLGYSSISGQTLSSNIRVAYIRVILPFIEWMNVELGNIKEHSIVSQDTSILEESESDADSVIVTDVLFDGRILPRIDVADYRTSINKNEWRKLNYDIIIEEPKPTTEGKRHFEKMLNPVTQPSFSFLKQFRKLESRANTNDDMDKMESQYLALPQFFTTESVQMKLYLDSEEERDFDSWDYMALGFRNNALACNLGRYNLPLLHAGGQFTTYTNDVDKEDDGGHTIAILLHGGRTWYTKDGTWVDQNQNEVVIVKPGIQFTNWSHGYSALIYSKFYDPKTWVNYSMTNFSRMNLKINIAQVLAGICNSDAKWIPKELLTQTKSALEKLAHEEAEYERKAISFKIATNAPPFDEIHVCSQTGQHLFFSWIEVNNTFISPSSFFARRSRQKAKFITKNGELPQLMEKLDEKIKQDDSWTEMVIETLQPKTLPPESKIWQLILNYPESMSSVSMALRQFLSNFYSDANVFDGDFNTLRTHLSHYNELFDHLVESLENNNLEMSTKLISELNELDSKLITSPEKHNVIDTLMLLSTWCNDVLQINEVNVNGLQLRKFDANRYKKDQDNAFTAHSYLFKLRSLVAQAEKLELPHTLKLFKDIKHRLDLAQCGVDSLRVLLYSCEAINPESIRMTSHESEEWKAAPTDDHELQQECQTLCRKFHCLLANVSLIKRMYRPVFTQRPKRSEMTPLLSAEIPEINKLVDELQTWLSEATQLDWIAITRQISLVTQGVPPHSDHMPASPISITKIAQVYSKLYGLKIVCDDVENVQATFANALTVLNNIPIQTLMLYGFIP